MAAWKRPGSISSADITVISRGRKPPFIAWVDPALIWENRPILAFSDRQCSRLRPAIRVIAPYGGTLVDLMVPAAERDAVKVCHQTLEMLDRNACDVELLVVGGFSPLRGFMHQEDYDAVVSGHRLAAGRRVRPADRDGYRPG